MANEKQLAIFQETRNELVQTRNERIGRLQATKIIWDQTRANLTHAEHQERLAVVADNDLCEKQRVLVESLNGMTEKPQYLMDKVSRLTSEQLQTHRTRIAAHEIVQMRQRETGDAERNHSLAQTSLQQSDRDIADIDAKIREAQQNP